MRQNTSTGFGFPPSARQRASLAAVGSAMDPQSVANGGLVRGTGTGTSDSVKDAVPPGTYIMPADSTQQIGPEKLAGLGFKPGMRAATKAAPAARLGFKGKGQRAADEPPAEMEHGPGLGFQPRGVPVNLSNGEFKLTPKQVHAIGAEVLEGMKDATHEATEPREEGEGDSMARDGLFFADGGLVPKRDPFAYQAPGSAPAATQPSPIPGAERPAQPTFKPDTSAPSPVKGPMDAIGTAYGETAKKLTFGGFDSRADDIQARNRGGLTADPVKPSAPAAMPGQPLTTNPGLSAVPSATQAPSTPSAPAGAATSVSGVRRIDETGKAPLFTNVGPDGTGEVAPQSGGFGFRPGMGSVSASPTVSPGPGLGFRPGMGGGSDVMGILQRESQIRAGMGELQDRINFNGGGFGFRKVGTDEAIRDMVVNGNSRDRATALGFLGGRQDAADRAGLAQQDLGLRQQDMQGRQGIAEGELGLRREAQGFQSAAQRRLQALQDRYVAEDDPSRRAELAQQIREIGGREPSRPDSGLAAARANLIGKLSEQYATMATAAGDKKMPSFEAWSQPLLRAAGMAAPDPRQQEGVILRGKDGKMYRVQNGAPVLVDTSAGAAPAVGNVVDGHRSRGGNPSDRNSWEKV